MEEIDLSKELQDFYEKNKHEKSIRNWEETLKKSKGFLSSNFLKFNVINNGINPESKTVFTSIHSNDEFIFSFRQDVIFVYKTYFLFSGSDIDNNVIFYKINYSNYEDVEIVSKKTLGEEYPILKLKNHDFHSPSMIDSHHLRLFNELDFIIKKRLEEEEKIKDDIMLENVRLEEEQRLKELKISQTNVLSELDKDGNGIIDVIEGGDDFMKLFRKHQSVIKDFDKNYINHLVKISNYLKTKRSNIQQIFLEIRKTKNQSQLDENVGLLKNQIHTYEVVLFHSLSIITSIVEDDLITVNEIYEEFDKLKIFKTDHEKEVSQKLSDIGDGLSSLMYSINSMERNIVDGLNTLSYVTQDGFSDLNSSLSRELQSIDSSIQTNNLITGIQTYQLYKINKQTKGLID